MQWLVLQLLQGSNIYTNLYGFLTSSTVRVNCFPLLKSVISLEVEVDGSILIQGSSVLQELAV